MEQEPTLFEFLNSVVGNSGDLLNILGMIGIALLTILIPIAVAIFGEKKEFEVLDRNVILDHVVRAKWFFIVICLVYVPLVWAGHTQSLSIFGAIIWLIGVSFLLNVSIRAYGWMKGNKHRLRLAYLRGLNDPRDLEDVWQSVWQAENINAENERDYFTIYAALLDKLLRNED